jgi:hypothetical protein
MATAEIDRTGYASLTSPDLVEFPYQGTPLEEVFVDTLEGVIGKAGEIARLKDQHRQYSENPPMQATKINIKQISPNLVLASLSRGFSISPEYSLAEYFPRPSIGDLTEDVRFFQSPSTSDPHLFMGYNRQIYAHVDEVEKLTPEILKTLLKKSEHDAESFSFWMGPIDFRFRRKQLGLTWGEKTPFKRLMRRLERDRRFQKTNERTFDSEYIASISGERHLELTGIRTFEENGPLFCDGIHSNLDFYDLDSAGEDHQEPTIFAEEGMGFEDVITYLLNNVAGLESS